MKINSVHQLFFRIVMLFAASVNSQVYAQLNANNLTQYTELDGLPSSAVNQITNDKFGYLWIGTINGLARFDGYEFKRFYFNPNDTASIHGLVVWSILEDRKGNIWTGNSPSFVNEYNPTLKNFKQFPFTHLIKHTANTELDVSAMCEDKRGRIYYGVTTQHGETISSALLYKDEDDQSIKSFTTPDSLTIQNVLQITRDKWGNVWLLTYNGLFKIDTDRNLSRIHLLAETILAKNKEHISGISFDRNGEMWMISCKSRLYHLMPKNDSFQVFTPPLNNVEEFDINSLAVDKHNNLWMGTNNGLLKFNTDKENFEIFNNKSEKQLEKAVITNLRFDSFGTLWIGTASQGLLKYEERAVFKSFSNNKDEKKSISSGWASSIYETTDGKIWVSTIGTANASGAINEIDPKNNSIRSIPIKSIIPGAFSVTSVYEIEPGKLAISSYAGNYLFSTQTKAVTKLELTGLGSVFINQWYKDSKGNLWLCTMNGLFKKTKNEGAYKRYDLSTIAGCNASSNEITKVVESTKHGLWLATNNGLFLYSYNTDKIERHGYDKKAGNIFITQDINSLYEDAAGMLWVGNWQGGLNMYNSETKKIKTYTQNEGLPSMCIQGILADEKNKSLWLSTFEGLSRFDLQTRQFNNFSIADGIQSQLFADGAYLKTSGGFLVFGGSNGITVFNPNEINKKSTPPLIFLTDLKLFNKSVVPGDNSILKKAIYDTKEIILTYEQNNISLEFIGIHYSNPSKNKYLYKLENYDNEWRSLGNQHTAFYPALPPGKYVFRVKAANNNGVWNEQGASISITITPPWWKTTIAYLLYALLFIAILFAFDRYFRRRLIRKENEKNRARELEYAKEVQKAYHELKEAQQQLIQAEKMASLGELTAGIAHEIQNPLNFVNNFSEVNKELADELGQEIDRGNYADAKAIANDIKINEEKISHHGKRADAIVKGMLQHSRTSTGVKEPTDINALADEYLRLSYHGVRAKDKTFNVTLKTDFDESIGNVNIISQDIGRVILNLVTNAFYAVNARLNESFGQEKNKHLPQVYEPTVSIVTKKINDKVEIDVSDNGNGIPQKIVDKIFQPFFTTKPTGQGTGLGLSLSYDIIKAHGGEIIVESEEGKGATFKIKLPVG